MSGKEKETPRNELTSSQRGQIIGAFRIGNKPLSIVKTFGFARETVYRIIRRYNETGSEDTTKHHGWPKILSERDKRMLNRIAGNNRQAPLAISTRKINTNLEHSLSTKTICGYLKEIG